MRRSKEREEADVRRDWYGEALAGNSNMEGCRDDKRTRNANGLTPSRILATRMNVNGAGTRFVDLINSLMKEKSTTPSHS